MDDLTPYPKVTPQQHSFVLSYLLDFSIKDACKRVGISSATGTNWLKLAPIRKMIQQKAKDVEQIADVTIAQVVNELKRVAFFDHKDYMKDFKATSKSAGVTLKDFEDMDTRAIQSMNVKVNAKGKSFVEIKPYNKVDALKELLAHLKGHQGPSSVHLHITEDMAKRMSSQEIAADYQTIVGG